MLPVDCTVHDALHKAKKNASLQTQIMTTISEYSNINHIYLTVFNWIT